MRSKRSHDKYAPILTEEKYKPERKEVVTTIKPVELKEFKFESRWINYQLDGLFKGW